MTRDELLAKLREMVRRQEDDASDKESDHITADEMLLAYIGDSDITEAFMALERWYA